MDNTQQGQQGAQGHVPGMQVRATPDRTLIREGGGSSRYVHLQVCAPAAIQDKVRDPVRVGFALDRSGSMAGEKLELASRAVIDALELLEERDEFNVVFFDGHVDTIAGQAAATPTAKGQARRACERVRSGGSTNLAGGWAQACANLSTVQRPETLNLCVLLTDGMANVGESDPTVLAVHARNLRKLGVVTTCIGVGEGFHEELLKGMADAADGRFYFASEANQLKAIMATEVGEALEVVARAVALEIAPRNGGRLEALGTFRAAWTGQALRIELGDLCSRQQLDTVLRVVCPPGHAGEALCLDIRLLDGHGRELSAAQQVTLTYASGAQNDRQPRDRAVDRLVAQHYADRARMEAVPLNRNGDYAQARAALHQVADRIARYAGEDDELRELVRELMREGLDYSRPMQELQRKQEYSSAAGRTKSRSPDGSSTRYR